MEILNIIFIGLSAVATLGLLVCTIIGFIFINKQTNILISQLEFSREQLEIAKNKEIVLIIQKSLENEMNEYIKHDYEIFTEIKSFIKENFYDPNYNNSIGKKNYHASLKFKSPDQQEDIETKYQELIKNLITHIPKNFFELYYWALNDKQIEKLVKIRKEIDDANILDKIRDLRSLEMVITDNQMNRVEFETVLRNELKNRMTALTNAAEKLGEFLSDLGEQKKLL